MCCALADIMYRSQGELQSYARRVFSLYATDGALSMSRFKLAWYVLWGSYPDDNISQTFFSDTHLYSNSEPFPFSDLSGAQPGCAERSVSGSGTSLAKSMCEDKFLRSVVTYYDTMGSAAGIPPRRECGAASDGFFHFSGRYFLGNSVALRRVLFESLAGAKGYVTLDDLLAVESVDWLCVSENDDDTVRLKGRAALLSHAFAIADADKDGRLVFSDFEQFLTPGNA